MIRLASIVLFLAFILTGCFTGVESTPKITDKDMRRQRVTTTDEERFLSHIAADPMGAWRSGKQWYVSGPKVRLMMSTNAPADYEIAVGDTLTLEGAAQAPGITGNAVTVLNFTDSHGYRYDYRIDQPADSLSSRRLSIPYTIDLDVVARVDSLMRGNTYYIVSRLWLDQEGQPYTGKKFVPVRVTSVTAGNDIYPLRVNFIDPDGNIRGAFMSVGSDRSSMRNFDSIFSFTDPALRYKGITPQHWTMIINGEITEDMTREECRLSLGSPKSIDTLPGYGGVTEQWIYDDGRYLIFQDGLLRQYRK
ncbi:MAG: hypothetical protein K2L93_03445 [Muribaculaceae bacterium]|nr:hypothetical protein [Muribaculaceae bacterium]